MTDIPLLRRFALCSIGLLLAAAVFRTQISSALVVRGDDFVYRSDLQRARAFYARALWFDPDDGEAADRFAFFGMQRKDAASLESCVDAATAYLRRHPGDARLRVDRALCYAWQRRYDRAERDFERAAQAMRDSRYFVFAGWAARRLGERERARSLWRSALAVDPHSLPARRALRARLP